MWLQSCITLSTHFLELCTWQDYLECIGIIYGCYRFLAWLAQEPTHNLIPLVYTWVGLIIGARFLHLETLFILLMLTTPCLILAAALFHETKLQKNFILHKTKVLPKALYHWQQHLIKSLLHAINKHLTVICFIEGKDTLHTLLRAQMVLHAPATSSMYDMLFATSQENPLTLWISQSGTLIGSQLQFLQETTHHQTPHLTQWLAYSQLMTTHNDTIVIVTEPETRTYALIQEGTMLHNLNADHVLRILMKATTEKKEYHYAENSNVHRHESNHS